MTSQKLRSAFDDQDLSQFNALVSDIEAKRSLGAFWQFGTDGNPDGFNIGHYVIVANPQVKAEDRLPYLQSLKEAGYRLDVRSMENMSPIYLAVTANDNPVTNLPIINYLLENGVTFAAKTKLTQDSVLLAATRAWISGNDSDGEVFKQLINHNLLVATDLIHANRQGEVVLNILKNPKDFDDSVSPYVEAEMKELLNLVEEKLNDPHTLHAKLKALELGQPEPTQRSTRRGPKP